MSVTEKLSEEEAYLWAILSDTSGLDQAEFSWNNAEEEDYCFRAWSFQWGWWRDTSSLTIDQCGRSVGKSLSIKVRAYAFPFIHPGQEMVITAPEGNHLDAVTDVIETAFLDNRLGKEMLRDTRGNGIKHRPFHMNFANGSRIMGRIPQRDGRGVKGIHPVWLELDEAQDYPDKGWVEIFETVKHGTEGAMWRAHGVTRGMRDYFYKFTQDDSGWKVNRYTAMHRPTWTMEEREAKIAHYGSRDHPDYRRNVLGLHGDATNPIFVLNRLMACFLGDTKVDSPDGEKLIKDLQPGDTVYNAYDESEVLAVNVTERDEIYEVIVDGISTFCTAEHPFFTDRGWTHADELRNNDRIYTRQEILRMVRERDSLEEEQEILLEKLYADVAWTNLSWISD